MYENTYPNKRFKHTLDFVAKHIGKSESILDLGVTNPLAELLKKEGYHVTNTQGEDLDDNQDAVKDTEATVVTAFEICEHLLAPYNVLKEIKAEKLVASIPLKLWFAKAYQNKNDSRDRHYHEFEAWQFDWLLEKAGWTIVAKKQWCSPVKKIGLRPILRLFTPRYYLVYAERSK